MGWSELGWEDMEVGGVVWDEMGRGGMEWAGVVGWGGYGVVRLGWVVNVSMYSTYNVSTERHQYNLWFMTR